MQRQGSPFCPCHSPRFYLHSPKQEALRQDDQPPVSSTPFAGMFQKNARAEQLVHRAPDPTRHAGRFRPRAPAGPRGADGVRGRAAGGGARGGRRAGPSSATSPSPPAAPSPQPCPRPLLHPAPSRPPVKPPMARTGHSLDGGGSIQPAARSLRAPPSQPLPFHPPLPPPLPFHPPLPPPLLFTPLAPPLPFHPPPAAGPFSPPSRRRSLFTPLPPPLPFHPPPAALSASVALSVAPPPPPRP